MPLTVCHASQRPESGGRYELMGMLEESRSFMPGPGAWDGLWRLSSYQELQRGGSWHKLPLLHVLFRGPLLPETKCLIDFRRTGCLEASRQRCEMCDVCDTTIFNLHWVCPRCGFGVCGLLSDEEENCQQGELTAFFSQPLLLLLN